MHGCPLELLPPQQGLIEALDMNVEDARRWHRQLYREIRLEPRDDDAGTHSASDSGASKAAP